jgi:hypothetical protein
VTEADFGSVTRSDQGERADCDAVTDVTDARLGRAKGDRYVDDWGNPGRTVGRAVTRLDMDGVEARIRAKAAEASERFRAVDPRRHGMRLPEAATAKSEAQRWEAARAKARETKAQLNTRENTE